MATIQQFLLVPGTALLTALGGSYVVIDRVPAGFTNSHPLIVITTETAGAHVSGADYMDVVMFRCYGGSKLDSAARAIHAVLYDRLLLPGQTTLAAGNIKQTFYMNDFAGPDDPVQGWPNHIGRYQIHTEGL